MTFKERFDWIFEHRGTNANALSEAAGLSRSYIRMLLKSEAKGTDVRPGADALDAIAKAANVAFPWLARGQGPREPYQPGVSPVPPSAIVVRDEQQEKYRCFGDLPGWNAAEAEAKRLYGDDLPLDCWEAARGLAGNRWPEEITPQTIFRFARAWFEQAGEEERIQRERKEIRAQLTAYKAKLPRTDIDQ